MRRQSFHFAQIQWALDNARAGSMQDSMNWYVYATAKGFVSTVIRPTPTQTYYLVSAGYVQRVNGD